MGILRPSFGGRQRFSSAAFSVPPIHVMNRFTMCRASVRILVAIGHPNRVIDDRFIQSRARSGNPQY
jgi:hypothetical protein